MNRIDHPSRDPGHERAVKVGKERLKRMTFESEAQKRDYMRKVEANPFNVPGLPELFPAPEVRSRHIARTKEEREADENEVRILSIMSGEVPLYCGSPVCQKVTRHLIDNERSLCLECKFENEYTIINEPFNII